MQSVDTQQISEGKLRARNLPRDALPFGIVVATVALVVSAAPALAADDPALPVLDTRGDQRSAAVASAGAQVSRPARELRSRLGPHGVVELDRVTDVPRRVAKLNGYLTSPSDRSASEIVFDYVRTHRELFKLDEQALGRLRLVRRYVSRGRVVHLAFAQVYDDVPALDQTLVANVTTDGKLINVFGSPRPDLSVGAVVPTLSARQALGAALRDAGSRAEPPAGRGGAGPRRTTTFRGGQRASLVFFAEDEQARLAWRVLVRPSPDEAYDTVIDAQSGQVLRRHSLIRHASAQVFDHFPGAPRGGTQRTVDITPYLTSSTRLLGAYAYVSSDVNDDNVAQPSEEVPPSAGSDYLYPYTPFPSVAGGTCPAAPFFCSWNHNLARSWQTNRRQNATQAFYYVNHFHDHLEADPIEFVPEKGNFDATFDGDQVFVDNDDGADLMSGLPDTDHINNANFFTPPDGFVGEMQMYLFRPSARDPAARTINGGDDASLVYHEYTHGLSNRLIIDGDGFGALNWHQSASMGEAWSDWYALDALEGEGYVTDTPADGDVEGGTYLGSDFRTQGLDCPIGSGAPACPGSPEAGPGGYTYGDMGEVIDYPETHADGEIWAQTLWDLRRRLIAAHGRAAGISTTRLLVTAGMELSLNEPSFLDMRDTILQADTVYNGGRDRGLLWSVFANRGMGYVASTVNATDARPIESFAPPPTAGAATGTLSGTVTTDAGDPVAGALVYFGGHAANVPGDLFGFTDASGRYTIDEAPAATYPQVVATGNRLRPPPGGYDLSVATDVTISPGQVTTRDFTVVRDWAALAGGARTAAVTGEPTPGCGPGSMVDQDFSTAWRTSSPAYAEDPGPKFVTVRLPAAVDVSSFAIDPAAGKCGTGVSAALGRYRLEVSADGVSFREVASGAFTRDDVFRRNIITPASGTTDNVRFVRLVGVSTQGSAPEESGRRHMEVSELQVYGSETPPTTAGRMLGKGSITSGTMSAAYAYILSCDAAAAEAPAFEIRFAGRRFRLSGVTSARCTDDPATSTPTAGFDTQEGTGTGTLDGAPGATVEWRFVDGGSGGADDSARLTIKSAAGTIQFEGAAAPPGTFPGSSQSTGNNTAQAPPP